MQTQVRPEVDSASITREDDPRLTRPRSPEMGPALVPAPPPVHAEDWGRAVPPAAAKPAFRLSRFVRILSRTIGIASFALLIRLLVNYFMPNFIFVPVVGFLATMPVLLTISTIAAAVLWYTNGRYERKLRAEELLATKTAQEKANDAEIRDYYDLTPSRAAVQTAAGIGLVAAGAAFVPGFATALNASVLSFNLIKTAGVAAVGMVAGDVLYDNVIGETDPTAVPTMEGPRA